MTILAVAMNPEWSAKLSAALYGDEGLLVGVEATPTPLPEATPIVDLGANTPQPQNTPMVYDKPGDGTGEENQDGTYKPKTIDIKTVCPTVQGYAAYVEPSANNLNIPDHLNGFSGYAEISGTLTEVEADEIAKLLDELDEGDTGALLVFDQNFYPYYHMLNDNEKELYRQIYANAYAMRERFKPCVSVYSVNVGRVVEAVYNDNPILFWVETSYGCKYGADGTVVEISLQYNETVKKADQSKDKFFERAEEILSVARTLKTDYDKEKYVHDKLVSKVTYAAEAPMNQTAYSALVNGQTVCAGYARAFQYLMQQLGIPCYYCRGYSGENHAWNIIRLYGEYYNVDVTWDDTVPSTYDYFNKNDADFAQTHIRRSSSVKLPACGGTLYGGLEAKAEELVPDDETSLYSAGLMNYYDMLCGRIADLGLGKASYSDVVSAEVWKELEKVYSNGNASFREDTLIRAMHAAGAEYCIISLSAEEITENAFEVTSSVIVR